ncbi:DUF1579 domain-containing protein [Paractinoplanes lichenicola]|uniref:DUF1579 domain-containing protein n=1 Tax=Paractinoplanes lichenicola TaxID=2802976 RepID=A0ABS1W0R0_9ACTN|nr:DUF1579 domain-containing protein [Actinoplanes lichenicola]MBL7260317.1 DUF1579 domain-containing protein [Actinoplanes lichenicola]
MSLTKKPAKAVFAVAVVLAGAAISPGVAQAVSPVALVAEAKPAPIAALEPLSSLIGSWTCSGVTTGWDGTRTQFDTTSTAKFVLNGNWLRWQEASTSNGTPIGSAEYFWGWDAQQNLFTVDRYDDAGQRGKQTTPGWVGDVLTSTGDLVQPGGFTMSLTTTITKTGKKAFTVRAVADLGAAAGNATVVSESACTR